MAVHTRNIELVEFLLFVAPELLDSILDQSPFYLAANEKSVEILKLLLDVNTNTLNATFDWNKWPDIDNDKQHAIDVHCQKSVIIVKIF